MASPSTHRVLVVANSSEQQNFVSLLEEAGYRDIEFHTGSGEPVGNSGRVQPAVVVLCAGLDEGDPRAIARAMKQEGPVHIVLVGESDGPIRNALDAADFDVDRFVGRPVHANALAFSVRSGLERLGQPRIAVGSSQLERSEVIADPVAPIESVEPAIVSTADELMNNVMNTAIRNMVRDSMAALPVPELSPDLEAELRDLGLADEVAPLDAIDIVGEELVSAEGSLDVIDDDAGDIESGDGDEPEVADKPWRTTTEVLPPGDAHVAPAAPSLSGSIEADDTPPPAASGGVFARDLRRKMSQMAERLFPGEKNSALVDIPHGAHTEVNLGEVHVPATVVGGGAQSIGFDDSEDPLGDDTDEHYQESAFEDLWTGSNVDREGDRTRPAISKEGDITPDGVDVASVFAVMCRRGFTGRLRFMREDVIKSVSFERGRPVFASSSVVRDRMGDLLYREGKISREAHEESRELVGSSGRRVGEILVERGHLKPRELLPAVRRHLEDIIYSLFGWRDGSFEVIEEDAPVSEPIRLSVHPAAIVLEGIRRKYTGNDVRAYLGAENPVLEVLDAGDMRAVCSHLELSSEEARFTEVLDGRTSLAELVASSRCPHEDGLRVMFALIGLGVIKVVAENHAELGDGSASHSVDGTDVAIDRQRVAVKYQQVAESDYFRLLGVRKDATRFEIQRAHEAAVRDFSADAFSVELRTELSHELEEIRIVLDEAYRVLGDDSMRTNYGSNLLE